MTRTTDDVMKMVMAKDSVMENINYLNLLINKVYNDERVGEIIRKLQTIKRIIKKNDLMKDKLMKKIDKDCSKLLNDMDSQDYARQQVIKDLTYFNELEEKDEPDVDADDFLMRMKRINRLIYDNDLKDDPSIKKMLGEKINIISFY